MTTDLFLKITMKSRLIDFAHSRRCFSSVDLERFKDEIKVREGIVKGLMRIHRTARSLAQQGIFRRLNPYEKMAQGLNKKFVWYVYNKFGA